MVWVGTTGEVTNLAYLFGGWRLAICDLRFGWGRPARLGNRAYRVWWLVVSGLGGDDRHGWETVPTGFGGWWLVVSG